MCNTGDREYMLNMVIDTVIKRVAEFEEQTGKHPVGINVSPRIVETLNPYFSLEGATIFGLAITIDPEQTKPFIIV